MKKRKEVMPPIRATIRFSSYPNEIWKEFFPVGAVRRYMVSNMGRVASFSTDLHTDGYILKLGIGTAASGAKISLKTYTKGEELTRYGLPRSVIKNLSLNVHNLVAEAFIGPPGEDEVQVIHLDHDKFNNHVSNLRWATKDDAWEHAKKSMTFKPRLVGKKLTIDRVRLIKRKLAEGKTKQGLLAKQFGLSEMGIYRIKTGKSWKEVTI
jgi:HNH endonuclease/NUMOD4 motif